MSEELNRAWAEIQLERDEKEQRAKYQRALKILHEIPTGTPDRDLTAEQRRAWEDHDKALAWLSRNRA